MRGPHTEREPRPWRAGARPSRESPAWPTGRAVRRKDADHARRGEYAALTKTQQYLAIASLALAASCGGSAGSYGVGPPGGGGGGTPPPANCTPGAATVCMETSNSFNPTSITVAKGSTVTWSNTTGVTHNVTFNAVAGAPGSSSNFSSGNYGAMFGTAGSYPYHCTIHGLSMSGTVVVQ